GFVAHRHDHRNKRGGAASGRRGGLELSRCSGHPWPSVAGLSRERSSRPPTPTVSALVVAAGATAVVLRQFPPPVRDAGAWSIGKGCPGNKRPSPPGSANPSTAPGVPGSKGRTAVC